MSDNANDNKIKYIAGGLMLLVAVAIVYFAFGSKPKETTNIPSGQYSVDNESDPYKTLSYTEAVEKLNQADSKQMFYVGCRDCGFCVDLEKILKAFLGGHQDKNTNRDLIYKVEAGYSCIPEITDEAYEGYGKIFDFLVANEMTDDRADKQFGTPQFFYVENGKVVDELDNYDRTAEGLTELFKAHNYRGF